jgi:hypothetical protein
MQEVVEVDQIKIQLEQVEQAVVEQELPVVQELEVLLLL